MTRLCPLLAGERRRRRGGRDLIYTRLSQDCFSPLANRWQMEPGKKCLFKKGKKYEKGGQSVMYGKYMGVCLAGVENVRSPGYCKIQQQFCKINTDKGKQKTNVSDGFCSGGSYKDQVFLSQKSNERAAREELFWYLVPGNQNF